MKYSHLFSNFPYTKSADFFVLVFRGSSSCRMFTESFSSSFISLSPRNLSSFLHLVARVVDCQLCFLCWPWSSQCVFARHGIVILVLYGSMRNVHIIAIVRI